MLDNYFLFGAVLVASLGGVSDLRSARIPNWLTYSGLAVALLVRFAILGRRGFESGMIGMLIAGVCFFVLFVMGAMGGGDVKLMGCVGAWAGSHQVLSILLAAALAGGLLALVYVLFGQGIRKTFCNLADLIRFRVGSGVQPHPTLNVGNSGALRVPFGVAIAMGTIFCASSAFLWR